MVSWLRNHAYYNDVLKGIRDHILNNENNAIRAIFSFLHLLTWMNESSLYHIKSEKKDFVPAFYSILQ